MPPRRTRVRAAALVAVVALFAACGEDGGGTATDPETPGVTTSESSTTEPTDATSPTPSPTPSDPPKTEPTCESVWVEGAILPRDYRGCFNGEKWVRIRPIYCSFGGRLVTYDNRYWAAPGRAINLAEPSLRKDPDFQQAYGACTA